MLPTDAKFLQLLLICMGITAHSPVDPDINCDMENFTKNFQLFEHQKVNWITAVMGCVKLNMTLASIENHAEQKQVTEIVASRKHNVNIWIGATSQHAKNDLVWLSSGQRMGSNGFENWAIGEPDPSPNDCAFVFRKTAKWGTYPCTRVGYYLCEFLEKKEVTK